jgi:hypothetical protein
MSEDKVVDLRKRQADALIARAVESGTFAEQIVVNGEVKMRINPELFAMLKALKGESA